jgi:hypothetical protein
MSSNKRPGGVGMGNPLLERTFVCWTGSFGQQQAGLSSYSAVTQPSQKKKREVGERALLGLSGKEAAN